MRRTWYLASAALALTGLAAAAFLAQPPREAAASKADDAPEAATASLPVGRVALFSSGVGYFQREGTVEGSARVDLSFPVTDVNDLIKSMTLRDLDGGRVSAVSYDSSAPLERTLQSFAVNLTGNPTFASILNQARGEKVEVALAVAGAGAAGVLSGTVVGVEQQRQAAGKDVVEQAVLNLWCADGVRAVKLAEVVRVRFASPVMENEFRKALETLALSHDTQKKAVAVHFEGEGKRRVRVGYVVENPVWKTSYRLALGAKPEERPQLQGWAVVENTTDEDWKGVRMALISGRPISFQMDLYQPLYVSRPVVVPELFASLRPVAYSGGLNEFEKLAKGDGEAQGHKPMEQAARAAGGPAAKGRGATLNYNSETLEEISTLQRMGVSAAATAARLGDFFQYALDKPVSLPRQKSALLPIVDKEVDGARVSIYNERTQPKFPLLGLKFRNTSGLHLMQGPVTVFDGPNYAGDARILDLQPGEERLLSYAVDLGTEIDPRPAQDSGRVLRLRAVKGVVWQTSLQRQSRVYAVKNRGEQDRLVLVEHPVRHDMPLVKDCKPAETAADFYRFELKVPAGASKELTVTEEREFNTTFQVSTQGDEQVRVLMSQPLASEKLKAGLKKALELRWGLAKVTAEVGEQERQLRAITEDQDRLRKNLASMPQTAAAYKRYLEKFDTQETQIEKYQAEVRRLQAAEHEGRKAFEDYLANFSAE